MDEVGPSLLDLDYLQTVYVTGLGEGTDESLLHAAFVPYGEISDIILPPLPGGSGAPKFALIQYECKEDALAAIDNMHRSEINGRPIRASVANPAMLRQIASNMSAASAAKPVWEDAAWLQTHGAQSSI